MIIIMTKLVYARRALALVIETITADLNGLFIFTLFVLNLAKTIIASSNSISTNSYFTIWTQSSDFAPRNPCLVFWGKSRLISLLIS